MPTYIGLIEYTEQGIANMEDSPDRLDDARELAGSHGGEITDFYLTLGQYDAIFVAEFPDDESYTRFAIDVSSAGAVGTETLKAFTEDEYRELIAGLGGETAGPIGES